MKHSTSHIATLLGPVKMMAPEDGRHKLSTMISSIIPVFDGKNRQAFRLDLFFRMNAKEHTEVTYCSLPVLYHFSI